MVQPLILYHFGTKDDLWRAVAEDSLGQIVKMWERIEAETKDLPPAERIRSVFRAFFEYTVNHPPLHQFMLQENLSNSERLEWLSKNFNRDFVTQVVELIRQAQADGEMIEGHPGIIYYMLLGNISILSSFGKEMRLTIDFAPPDDGIVDEVWAVIERMLFRLKPTDQSPAKRLARKSAAVRS